MAELWTEKHFPGALEEFIGNSEIVKEIQLWAVEWNKRKTGKPLLLFGPVGSGKACLAHLVARLNGWELFELNASDFRTKDMIERLAGSALQNASFSGKLRLVLLDEVDGVQGKEDKGGMSAILEALKNAKNPVVLTANDIYSNKQMATIRNYCKKLEFKKINYLSVVKRLKEVCEKENIEYDLPALQALAKESNGDVRAALTDLQFLSLVHAKITLQDVQELGFREREEKIFSVLGKIFHAKTISEAQQARFASEVSDDLLLRWIEENIPLEFKHAEEAARAWEQFSKADVFNGRILRRQHYGFLRYSSELMTSGVAFARSFEGKREFVLYKFPSLLSKLSAAAGERALRKQLAEKIQQKSHASQRKIVSQDLPFWKALFENKRHAVALSAEFELDENEIAFLMNSTPSSKKVQAVFQDAQALALKSKPKRKPLQALSEQELGKAESKSFSSFEPTSLHDSKGQLKLF